MSIKLAVKESLIYSLASRRQSPLVRAIARVGGALVKGTENYSFNQNLNGERRVLQVLGQDGTVSGSRAAAALLDVGANVGDWAKLALACVPQLPVHCFEIAPPTYTKLAAALGTSSRVRLNAFGLSDTNESIVLHYGAGHDGHSSIVEPVNTGAYEDMTAAVRSGDDYLEEQGLTAADGVALLKIDVEGAEHKVLRGFTRSLQQGRIAAIQFEYGRANILTHFILRDFYDFLRPYGFTIGKIYPRSVAFKDYELSDEDFIGPNYLPVKASHRNLVAALAR